jgi:putative tricarboxylic transport membrane protein
MNETSPQSRVDLRAIAVGLGLLGLAALVLRDAFAQTLTAVYGIGPTAMPYLVATFLGLLGVAHFVVAFRKGLPVPDRSDGVAIMWIGLGLLALIGCLAFGGGFILAAAVLFALTARAFGRRALGVDLAIGFTIGLAIHLLFTRLLALSLPSGPLERLF